MALRWVEGWELFNGTSIGQAIEEKYPADSGISLTGYNIETIKAADRNGGKSLTQTTGNNDYFETPAFTAQATWIVGFAFQNDAYETASPTSKTILEFVDGSTVHVRLRMATGTSSSNGIMEVVRGDGTLLAVLDTNFASDVWYYLEMKVTIDDSVGVVEVKVNETTDAVANLTNVDTRNGGNASCDRIRLYSGWMDAGDDLYLDDWYVCDDQGATNNDFLGDCHVEGLLPSGAGASADWTPSAGDNYAAVDEVHPDNDGTYVESSTATNKDRYAFGNLSRITDNIVGVQLNLCGRLTNASTPRTVTPKAFEGATEGNATDVTFSGNVNYQNRRGIFETNPDTGLAWTAAEIDAAEFGMELVS